MDGLRTRDSMRRIRQLTQSTPVQAQNQSVTGHEYLTSDEGRDAFSASFALNNFGSKISARMALL